MVGNPGQVSLLDCRKWKRPFSVAGRATAAGMPLDFRRKPLSGDECRWKSDNPAALGLIQNHLIFRLTPPLAAVHLHVGGLGVVLSCRPSSRCPASAGTATNLTTVSFSPACSLRFNAVPSTTEMSADKRRVRPRAAFCDNFHVFSVDEVYARDRWQKPSMNENLGCRLVAGGESRCGRYGRSRREPAGATSSAA